MNLLFFPETRYTRDLEGQRAEVSPAGGVLEKCEKTEGEVAPASNSQARANDVPPDTRTENGENTDPWLGRGRPSKKQFLLWGPYQGNILRELWLPLYLHAYPIVEFAAFVVSWSASGFLTANLTQQQAFGAPPYNFSSQNVGFTNFAILAGGLIGLVTSGPLSDWVSDHLTRRNNGIREPEMRLVTMIPYVIIEIIGCVIVAVGYENLWPWEAIVIVGYACLGIQVTSLPSIASTYAIDSYKPVTGSLFVTITM